MRRRISFRFLLRSAITLALLTAGLVIATGPAMASTTVGQTGAPSSSSGWAAGNEFAQTDAVMPGAGVVTSFNTESGTCPLWRGAYDFQVLRPLGSNQYLVVGNTGTHTDPCDSQLHSYPVNIPVKAGDVLGVYVVSIWQGLLSSSSGGSLSLAGGVPQPAVGDVVTANYLFSGTIDESATFVENAAGELAALSTASQGVGPGTSLADKCADAQAALAAGNPGDASSILNAYIHEVTAQRGKKIPEGTADDLVTAAQQIILLIGM